MCGIAGYQGCRKLSEDRIHDCLGLMWRRGPDQRNSYHHQFGDRHTHLLHSRLSIIDLDERASQPFSVGPAVLVFNGELYNYVELKKSLSRQGVAFRTTSDTEVLLQMLIERGWQGLDECEGMWAFGWYNEQDGLLVLGRDRFGEKPLYLFRDETGLYFGSEIKFIAALLGGWPAINYQHLYRFMVNGYKSLYKKREGFFQGVQELAAGSVLMIDQSGAESETRYWDFSPAASERVSLEEAVAGTREALSESVRLRLRADVPLAVCLSGGVDSNALAGIAKKTLAYDLHAFTIVNEDARYEEQEMVTESVSALELRHTPIRMQTAGFLPGLRRLVRQHDAPVYTITAYAHWLLMEAVAEHGYRVAFGGVGADELFSGYFDHQLLYMAEIAADEGLLARSIGNWERHVKPIVRNPFLQNPRAFIEEPGLRDHIFLRAETFGEFMQPSWSEIFAEADYPVGLLRRRMLNELFHEVVPVILHEEDLNAMHYSIENRSPFLDRKLFEWSLRIPTRHLVREGAAKAVLRAAVRGVVPDTILDNRRKVGFNAPIHAFLDVADPAVREQLLDRSPIFDLVRRDRIEALLAKQELPNSESKFLFNVLSSKMFLEEFAGS
ncbi:MAG: asparagine synthase (glutamine-hydrolyzing) [Candidatus Eisenbacteria sp.]|nr:asparagine synthase (glutamine-hydrolyzing) [Candidatus Eisenbacteria bacterium]